MNQSDESTVGGHVSGSGLVLQAVVGLIADPWVLQYIRHLHGLSQNTRLRLGKVPSLVRCVPVSLLSSVGRPTRHVGGVALLRGGLVLRCYQELRGLQWVRLRHGVELGHLHRYGVGDDHWLGDLHGDGLRDGIGDRFRDGDRDWNVFGVRDRVGYGDCHSVGDFDDLDSLGKVASKGAKVQSLVQQDSAL